MSAFYNEIEPFAAAWLRVLIDRGEIAPGIVDERDIRDIRPDELAGFAQCHFFAGIGGWSLAARLAGIPDDYPFWSGSCPCQPFSAAGGRAGFADERHLWPAFFHLIEQCEPVCVVGEQVSGGNVDPWFDLVQADLEGMGYAFGLCPAPSAGFGAPHIRDRAFWMADADQGGRSGIGRSGQGGTAEYRGAGRLAHAGCRMFQHQQHHRDDTGASRSAEGQAWEWQWSWSDCSDGGPTGGVAQPVGERYDWSGEPRAEVRSIGGRSDAARPALSHLPNRPGPTNGFWRDADWLGCTDGKWRPVEPGTFPLADGLPARVGRLRGYGNAINAQQAAAFLSIAMEVGA